MTIHDELAAAGLDPDDVQAAIDRALAEDVPTEDVTSVATIDPDARGVGVFAARNTGSLK